MTPIKTMLILLILLLAGATAGWMAHVFLPATLLVATSKWFGSVFGLIWAGMLWLLPKVEELTDSSGLSYGQHRRLETIIRSKISTIKKLVVCNMIAALLTFLPEALTLATLPLPGWIFALAGAAVGFALFGFGLFLAWREEIRAFRSRIKEEERLQAAREKALTALKGKDGEIPTVDSRLDGFRNEPSTSKKFPNGEHPA